MAEAFPPRLTPEEGALLARRRRGRNLALLAVLLGLAVLLWAITMVKMAHHSLAL